MKETTLIALLTAGCMPQVEPGAAGSGGWVDTTDTGFNSDTGRATEAAPRTLLVSTIASDYSLGAVATVDLETGAVRDALATTAGDAVVRASGGLAVVLNRLNTDSVRVYSDGWGRPELEFALPDLSNPQDVARCEDTLWVTQHNADHISGHHLRTGAVVGRIDLSPWSGTDGSAEAGRMVVDGDTVLVEVQQFNQDDGWSSDGGAVLRFPCAGGSPSVVAEVSPSPSIASGSTGDTLLVRTGLYGSFDGELGLIEANGAPWRVIASEAELERDITAAAISDDHIAFVSVTSDWTYQVHCLDRRDETRVDGVTSGAFLSDIGIDPRGRIWVAARGGWSGGGDDDAGLHIIDPTTCQRLQPDNQPIKTALNPYNLAFL